MAETQTDSTPAERDESGGNGRDNDEDNSSSNDVNEESDDNIYPHLSDVLPYFTLHNMQYLELTLCPLWSYPTEKLTSSIKPDYNLGFVEAKLGRSSDYDKNIWAQASARHG